jgi:hypothetical protein
LKPRKNANINEKMDTKHHATQIDSLLLLENEDIAVSGGPLNFEVLIYRNKLSAKCEATSQYEIVDSIGTQGRTV